MDLDRCFTVLYVRIDEWYKSEMVGQVNKHPSVSEQMSNSELLTVMSVGQWQVGMCDGNGRHHWLAAGQRHYQRALVVASLAECPCRSSRTGRLATRPRHASLTALRQALAGCLSPKH